MTVLPVTNQSDKPHIMPVNFWTEYKEQPGQPPRAVDWVQWIKIGDGRGASQNEAISRLSRSNNPVWDVVKPYYEAWKDGQEEPVDGTSLSAWPGCTQSMADMLRKRGIKTVEAFRKTPEAQLRNMGIPDVMGRVAAADAFLKAQAETSIVAAELKQRDDQIAALTAQVEEMADLVAQMKADQPKTPQKKRGRPPKNKVPDNDASDNLP